MMLLMLLYKLLLSSTKVRNEMNTFIPYFFFDYTVYCTVYNIIDFENFFFFLIIQMILHFILLNYMFAIILLALEISLKEWQHQLVPLDRSTLTAEVSNTNHNFLAFTLSTKMTSSSSWRIVYLPFVSIHLSCAQWHI